MWAGNSVIGKELSTVRIIAPNWAWKSPRFLREAEWWKLDIFRLASMQSLGSETQLHKKGLILFHSKIAHDKKQQTGVGVHKVHQLMCWGSPVWMRGMCSCASGLWQSRSAQYSAVLKFSGEAKESDPSLVVSSCIVVVILELVIVSYDLRTSVLHTLV